MTNRHVDSSIVYNQNETPAALADASDRLLNKAELAAFCGVRTRTIENWMKRGLPYYKITRPVRFRLTDVMAFLDANHRRCRYSEGTRKPYRRSKTVVSRAPSH